MLRETVLTRINVEELQHSEPLRFGTRQSQTGPWSPAFSQCRPHSLHCFAPIWLSMDRNGIIVISFDCGVVSDLFRSVMATNYCIYIYSLIAMAAPQYARCLLLVWKGWCWIIFTRNAFAPQRNHCESLPWNQFGIFHLRAPDLGSVGSMSILMFILHHDHVTIC